VGDAGERGGAGEKGQPVCITNYSHCHKNHAFIFVQFDFHKYHLKKAFY